MKNKYVLVVVCCMCFLQCARYPKVAYNIPADYPDDKRKELKELLDKGQKIYRDYCAGCHGIFAKGKDNIPNFSTTQLDNYSARVIRRDPKNHSVIANMSQAQLVAVLAFLRYKKTKVADTMSTGKTNSKG